MLFQFRYTAHTLLDRLQVPDINFLYQPLRPSKKTDVLENRLFQQYWPEGVMARSRQKRRSTQPFEEKPKNPVACASGKSARWLANYA